MAYATKAIVFSGSAAEGSLQIKSAKFYVDTAANGGTNEKYIGLTDQKMSASIQDEKKEYKQDGVMRVEVPVSRAAGMKFRLDEYDADHLAFALGLSSYLNDSVTGHDRVVISADMVTPPKWWIRCVAELVNGKNVEFIIPAGQVSVDGDVVLGGGNESPNFNGIQINVKATAATVNGESLLAYYEIYTPTP